MFFHFFFLFFFFFNDTATTDIYTLSLHDALPISFEPRRAVADLQHRNALAGQAHQVRSEEHTSELQSRPHLVCRLLLEKKKKTQPQLQKHQEHQEKSTINNRLGT